jgi:hypothetical protein
MIEIVKAVGVEPKGEYRLLVHFSDGSFGVHDFSTMVNETGPMVQPLGDPDYFARVFVEMGVLTWPNGFDIDSIQLHREMAAGAELKRDAAE